MPAGTRLRCTGHQERHKDTLPYQSSLSMKLQPALSPCFSIRQSDNFTYNFWLPLTTPPRQAAAPPPNKAHCKVRKWPYFFGAKPRLNISIKKKKKRETRGSPASIICFDRWATIHALFLSFYCVKYYLRKAHLCRRQWADGVTLSSLWEVRWDSTWGMGIKAFTLKLRWSYTRCCRVKRVLDTRKCRGETRQ